jgi:hypothetical protein
VNTFSNIKELINALHRDRDLLTEMFKKRKTLSYKYDYALDVVGNDPNRLQYLIDRSVIRQNGNFLEIDDQFLQFFEQVLEVNEEINTSYINENIESVKENITYYFNESNEARKYSYLRLIKNTLRKIGTITLRNVVDLKRNVETTFKNEPSYKVKKIKLENLDKKRVDIAHLIEQTELLISEDETTFFRSALDEELNRVIIQLKLQLQKSTHNIIDIEKQIIDFLNQIRYQSGVIEKLRAIKYMKDQFILQTNSNLDAILSQSNPVLFEPTRFYPLKLSIGYLQNNESALTSIVKISKKIKSGVNFKRPVADNISNEYLQTQVEEEVQVNLEEIRNGFIASSNNLFDFIMSYDFSRDISFDERVTMYCQLISQYESNFEITDKFNEKNSIEFALVYPK